LSAAQAISWVYETWHLGARKRHHSKAPGHTLLRAHPTCFHRPGRDLEGNVAISVPDPGKIRKRIHKAKNCSTEVLAFRMEASRHL